MSGLATRFRRRGEGWWRSRRRAPVPAATAEQLYELESRMVWIFGSPRSGSTWLMRLLAHATKPRAATIDEPRAGDHLALVELRADGMVVANDTYLRHPGYLLNHRYRDTWEPAMRELFAKRFLAEAVDQGVEGGPIVIKEPNGSQGAELIAKLMPEVRILHLQRDPADILDSQLDAATHGIWGAALGHDATEQERLSFLAETAALYALRLRATEAAVALRAPRSLTVRYEDLLSCPAPELRRILEWMGQAPDPALIDQAIQRHDFARTPESERGPGQIMRAAQPGFWRENMSPAEQQLICEQLGDVRARLGYE